MEAEARNAPEKEMVPHEEATGSCSLLIPPGSMMWYLGAPPAPPGWHVHQEGFSCVSRPSLFKYKIEFMQLEELNWNQWNQWNQWNPVRAFKSAPPTLLL
ncbi:unnamed protein product [Pleuronectes platessa]|uniref:Uncharacterized protein n=1 Tax=Pleuronectes platessa TaxID=8262 RepID=A0A9N7UB40_PLEPL|nr:unnamed protein product [Pleuronectes platessa]